MGAPHVMALETGDDGQVSLTWHKNSDNCCWWGLVMGGAQQVEERRD